MTRKYIWLINEPEAGWTIPGTLCLHEISSLFITLMAHLGELVWPSEVNQPIQLDEPVRTHNSSFYLYRGSLFSGVNCRNGLIFDTVWK